MNIRDRLYKWVHRRCLQERGTADALLSVGQHLAELASSVRDQQFWYRNLTRPAVVTVVVLGEALALESEKAELGVVPPGKLTPSGFQRITSKSETLVDKNGHTIELETWWRLQDCTVAVLVDVNRVRVQGIFHGINNVAMDSPIAFFKGPWVPGEKLRVMCSIREEATS